MSIFNNTMIDNTDGFVSEIVACDGYDVTLGGHYDAIMESFDDDLAVIEAMHAFDMAELEAMKESGTKTVATPVMEASLKEIWAKIKEFFVNLGKRIMAFFNSVADYVSSIVMSGATFVKKYKTRLDDAKTGFTFEKYDYSINSTFNTGKSEMKSVNKISIDAINKIKDIKIDDENILAKLTVMENEMDSSKSSILANLRKKLSGESDEGKYTEALFNKFRSGGKKKSVTVSDISSFVAFLEKSDELTKTIKEASESVKTTFSTIEKAINAAAKEAESSTKGGEYSQAGAKKAALMRGQIKTFSSAQSIFTRFVNAWSTAAKEATGVYKSICFKALTYKPEK